jgi:cellulose synthase/poly-beta-1,6-N-acetylglucosamine synthase-like glycosyltransferase
MLSIIIPIRNEIDSIDSLIERLTKTFADYKTYEIVAIDDYSVDGSLELLQKLAKTNKHLHVYKKMGPIGKGASVLEGIGKAKHETIALIDADLAYAPEQLPLLLEELKTHDIVVGDRVYVNGERKIKKAMAKVFKFLFGKVLLGLDFDIQSGLKVFHKRVITNMKLRPSQWSFEIEFMLKALNAGYTLKAVPIKYGSRKKGKGKMNFLQAGAELIVMSLYYRIAPFEPTRIGDESENHGEIGHGKKRYKTFTNLHHSQSAINTLSFVQLIILLVFLCIVIALFMRNWHLSLIVFIAGLSVLYFLDLLFNLWLIILSLRKPADEVTVAQELIKKKAVWPTYSIICPLYNEWEVFTQFKSAMDALDYPKDKLQVLIVLEEDDVKTKKEIEKMTLPSYYQVIVAPQSFPKTKPKACNYALTHTTGEYTVVYDAEDVPDPDQLKKAVVAFEGMEDEAVVCLQAKLNFYNPHQNLLTKLFTLEYSLWFDLVLTGLHQINGPIPLGGTSNHFKTKNLRLLQGWDPFNVAEDCDLGTRLFKYGFRTKMLDSYTMEEANGNFFSWFKQRSRWNKGYIQTYLVHMRRPHEFITDLSNPHIITFQLVVGGKILSSLINPFLWVMTITYFALRTVAGPFIESLYPTSVFYIAVFSLVFGNFLYFYYYMIGAAKREQWEMVKYAFFVPFYWLMMSYGTWIALQQVISKPHYWEKTTHGLHLKNTTS